MERIQDQGSCGKHVDSKVAFTMSVFLLKCYQSLQKKCVPGIPIQLPWLDKESVFKDQECALASKTRVARSVQPSLC